MRASLGCRVLCVGLLMISGVSCQQQTSREAAAAVESPATASVSTGGTDLAKGADAEPPGAPATDAAPGRLIGGRPVGVFFMTRFWSFSGTLEKAAWYFAPDGRVYQNPEHGFSPADLAGYADHAGTARRDGDQLEVTWSNGKVTSSRIEPDETGFAWDAGIFTAAQPFRSDTDIAGRYEGGESLTAGGNAVVVAKTLELRADHTFHWQGVAFVQAAGERTRISAGSESASSGTWSLSGYTLTLTDDSGTIVRQIAFPYDDEETPLRPDRMFFGGLMYNRQPG